MAAEQNTRPGPFSLEEFRRQLTDRNFHQQVRRDALELYQNLEGTMPSDELLRIIQEHVFWSLNRPRSGGTDEDESSFDLTLDDLASSDDESESVANDDAVTTQLYENGEAMCKICFDIQWCWYRPCCRTPFCGTCLDTYVGVQIKDKSVPIKCPASSCSAVFSDQQVFKHARTPAMVEKYRRFIVDLNADPNRKTCPFCNYITEVNVENVRRRIPQIRRTGFVVECDSCHQRWCFQCQSPVHLGLSCRQNRHGDRLLKSWAKHRRGYDQAPNAQKCPKCNFYIERKEGCDHMTCSKCHTDFCYRCGERYRSVQFLGNHHSRWSILGCKYIHRPNQPVRRKLERGSIFVSALVAAPLAVVVGAAAAAVLLGTGVLLGPAYGFYRLHKYHKEKRRLQVIAEWDRQCRQELVRFRWIEESLLRRKNLEEKVDPFGLMTTTATVTNEEHPQSGQRRDSDRSSELGNPDWGKDDLADSASAKSDAKLEAACCSGRLISDDDSLHFDEFLDTVKHLCEAMAVADDDALNDDDGDICDSPTMNCECSATYGHPTNDENGSDLESAVLNRRYGNTVSIGLVSDADYDTYL